MNPDLEVIDSFFCFYPSGSQTLLVEYSRGYPLCMDQYSRLFASCRLPGPKHDSVLLPPPGRRPPTYITVVRNFQVITPFPVAVHITTTNMKDQGKDLYILLNLHLLCVSEERQTKRWAKMREEGPSMAASGNGQVHEGSSLYRAP